MSKEFKIIIPSAGRATRVTTTKFVSGTMLCVPKVEEEAYAASNPGVPIIAHPDEIKGLPGKRNWIYENYGDVFMIDDDSFGISRHYNAKSRICTAEEAHDIIQMIGNVAAMAGCYLFGLSKYAAPLRYSGLKPIGVTGYINGVAIGLVAGSMLRFNEKIKITNDAYISLLNAYYYRRCYIDTRFGVIMNGINQNVGGVSLQRTPDTEFRDNEELIRCFGTGVIKLKQRVGTQKKYNLTIKLPF